MKLIGGFILGVGAAMLLTHMMKKKVAEVKNVTPAGPTDGAMPAENAQSVEGFENTDGFDNLFGSKRTGCTVQSWVSTPNGSFWQSKMVTPCPADQKQ